MGDVDWTILAFTDGGVTSQPMTPVNRPDTAVGYHVILDSAGARCLVTSGDRDTNTGGGAWTNTNPWSTTSAWTNEALTGTNIPFTSLATTPRCVAGALGVNAAGSVVLLALFQTDAGATGGLRRKVVLGTAGVWSTPATSVAVGAVAGAQRAHFAWPAGAAVWMLDPATGVWQSLDYGVTWTRRVTFASTNAYSNQIKASLSQAGVYYYTQAGASLWKITAGNTASPVITQLGAGTISKPGSVAVHPSNGKVYVTENADSPAGATLWGSSDGGTTFTDLTVASFETICTTVKSAHVDSAGNLWTANYAGYAKTTGLP
jgi:hypothetical protein